MKKYTVTGWDPAYAKGGEANTSCHFDGDEGMQVSDGYHTMDELYSHRNTLFIAMCRIIQSEHETPSYKPVWRSKLHSDGTMFEGMFVLGLMQIPGQQITYHLPLSDWKRTSFAQTLDAAPEWDNHTPSDVIERLEKL